MWVASRKREFQPRGIANSTAFRIKMIKDMQRRYRSFAFSLLYYFKDTGESQAKRPINRPRSQRTDSERTEASPGAWDRLSLRYTSLPLQHLRQRPSLESK